jgi:molecular chaperone DnaK (HSP70)
MKGLAYVTSDQESIESINVVREWGSNAFPVASKVPSVIAYETENTDEGLSGDQWGFQCEALKSYYWTKLLLGRDSRAQEASGNLKDIYGDGFCALPVGKSAKQVVTDYLRQLYKFLVERLQRHDEVLYQITPLEVWITVPAMWTDAAKNATIEAAQAAGFGSRIMDSIHMITEPEAAALSVLSPRVGMGAVTGLEVRESISSS